MAQRISLIVMAACLLWLFISLKFLVGLGIGVAIGLNEGSRWANKSREQK